MNSPDSKVTVVGIFNNPTNARLAVESLRGQSLDISDVSVVERNPSQYDAAVDYANPAFEYREVTTEELGDETVGGLVLGSLVGGTLGTLAGLGALLIPGIGPVIAAGPLVGALIGGTAGAVTGTLAGALIDAFQVPEEHAVVYKERLQQGNTMVAVHVNPAHATFVRDTFRTQNAERFNWDSSYQETYDNDPNWSGTVQNERRQPYVWVE